MIDYNNTRDVMSKPFSIAIHKRTFINYLEVIIDEEGNVHYAVPSHQEWLMQMACKKLNKTENEILDNFPPEYYFDMLKWLTKITECVAVWDIGYVGSLNRSQKATLELLQLEGLYNGKI